jgi:DNA-binding ferritin-like protein (Dps family)
MHFDASPQWWEICDSLFTADDTPERITVSTWLNCVYLVTGRGSDKRRLYQDDSDIIFVTILQFMGYIPKSEAPLYYEFCSHDEIRAIQKKNKKKSNIKKEFLEMYGDIDRYADIEGLTPFEKRSLLKDVQYLEMREIAAVEEVEDDYGDDLLNSIDPKLLQNLESYGFDF